MPIPNPVESLELLARYRVPAHVVAHSQRVAQIGVLLAADLAAAGVALSVDLVEAGGLLHDIAKMIAMEDGGNHAVRGEDLLAKLGYPEVGRLVGQHILLTDWQPGEDPNEAALVFYADKRVRHEEVVSLADRFVDLMARYGRTPEIRQRLDRMNQHTFALEETIFSRLSYPPERLNDLNREPLPGLARAGILASGPLLAGR
ncbi:MAG: HD domain-containing protein [Thermodesulfobacteriota bacterium]